MDPHRASSPAASQRAARIVDPHLPEGYSADPSAIISDSPAESSLALQGGDMHRDLYKIVARNRAPKRSQTFSHLHSPRPSIYEGVEQHRHHHQSSQPQDFLQGPSVGEQLVPGGFRRQYLQRQQLQKQLQRRLSSVATEPPFPGSFFAFLELYGSFAGEDLRDDDSDDEGEEEEGLGRGGDDDGDDGAAGGQAPGPRRPNDETRPLLATRKSSKRVRRETGDAGELATFFTLMKAFVGTGIMFLPKAFRNGGIVFSSVTLVVVAMVTTVCFRLLLQIRTRYGGGGYGDLGAAVLGSRFRTLVLGSITLSQLGFVCAGLIFTAENLLAFLHAVVPPDRPQPLGVTALILVQFVVLIPLALIRNISKLANVALLADVFILMGLVYIWYYDINSLAQRGIAPSVVSFNPSAFTLTIGSAIFTFEGIGLILPIQSSMRRPENFSYLLYLVMIIITVIFTSIGALCYATFGDETKIQVISNFPQDSKLVNAVQFLYSMAVMAGEPVQLFPAVRIMETKIFGERASGRKSSAIKWYKNGLRAAVMIFCGGCAIIGASDLDKFVSLIGSLACVPLVYIYPPLLHLVGVAETRTQKGFDYLLLSVGAVAMIYTGFMTIKQWAD